MELAKESGRKWADDAEATACKACSSGFTLTNRKHHCRNCGQIFCNDCSSKTAAMPNYRRPQRACDSCYAELVRGGGSSATTAAAAAATGTAK